MCEADAYDGVTVLIAVINDFILICINFKLGYIMKVYGHAPKINVANDTLVDALCKKTNNTSLSNKTLNELVRISNNDLNISIQKDRDIFISNGRVDCKEGTNRPLKELNDSLSLVSSRCVKSEVSGFIQKIERNHNSTISYRPDQIQLNNETPNSSSQDELVIAAKVLSDIRLLFKGEKLKSTNKMKLISESNSTEMVSFNNSFAKILHSMYQPLAEIRKNDIQERLKRCVREGVGNCGEMADLAIALCRDGGLDANCIFYEFDHAACLVKINGEDYIIDPWANLFCKRDVYLDKFIEKINNWSSSGKVVIGYFKENNPLNSSVGVVYSIGTLTEGYIRRYSKQITREKTFNTRVISQEIKDKLVSKKLMLFLNSKT